MSRLIDKEFVRRIGHEGALARAAHRIGHAQCAEVERLTGVSTWELICEEILDTEHTEKYYDRVINELYCRGLSETENHEMRTFAWRTVGWLNYDLMLWEWVALDENDILRAIVLLRRRKEISREEARVMKQYVARYLDN